MQSSEGGGDAATMAADLAKTKAQLEIKDKAIHEANELERAAKAKIHELDAELQTLRAQGATADDNHVKQLEAQVQSLEQEKNMMKNQATQLQGQIDLLKAEAAKGSAKSGGCAIQ